MKLKIAGAQMPVTRDVSANLETIMRAIDYAVAEEADVLLTPEGSLSGYTHDFDQEVVSAALDKVTAKARDAGLALALGTCFVEAEDGRCYDQIRFYDKSGTYLGFHSKILRCGSLTGPLRGEINHYQTTPLRTFLLEGITIGGLICNDLWANPCCTPMDDPHLTQKLANLGARIILHAVNGGRDASEFSDVARQYHEANLRYRARAGNLWIVTVDNCSPLDLPCSSPSGVLNPKGNWALSTPLAGEAFFTHTIEIDT